MAMGAARTVARQACVGGTNAEAVARGLVDQLADPELRLAIVCADRRLDVATLVARMHEGLAVGPGRRAKLVGGTAAGVIARGAVAGQPGAVALGLYGDWVRVGVGMVRELSRSALPRSRDAVLDAMRELGVTASQLDPTRHVGVTIVDGTSGHEEAFCIGSAAAAPGVPFVGGAASLGDDLTTRGPTVWSGNELLSDAGVVVMIESALPIATLQSVHLVPTALKVVVTAATGRVITEIDGFPALPRLRALLGPLAATLVEGRPPPIAFARYIDGMPYARSMAMLEGTHIHLAASVDVGHVLHMMEPGDLIGTTRRDLAEAAARLGGDVAALLAFSCISRHWEAATSGRAEALDAAYAEYPVIGFQSAGEQSGMLLVNHTLTGLVIGSPRG